MPPTARPFHPTRTLYSLTEPDDQAQTQSIVGIAVAIGGNVLISLALNCQKLAHKRLALQEQERRELNALVDGNETDSDGMSLADTGRRLRGETQPLISDGRDSYTVRPQSPSKLKVTIPRDTTALRRSSGLSNSHVTAEQQSEDLPAVIIEVPDGEGGRTTGNKSASDQTINEEENDIKRNETDYLRSKLWWLGFLLMNVGEFGNFLSYAYAPASVVAPLGTVALIANCIFAPLMLKEKLRKRDFLGVTFAIFGAVTIVGAGKSSDVRLDPAGLIRAIIRRPFVIYAIICAVLIIVFGILSAGPAGRKWVLVDIGLCALFGGFTVLATKAVSTLLSLHWIEMFKDWITYPILTILIVTGIGQIKYLNRALMKFDSKVVIPTFFVSFNLSAIVGSAILYGDFENVQVHQFTTFLYGCATTFIGVTLLTRSTEEAGAVLEETVVRPDNTDEDDQQAARTQTILLPSSSGGLPILKGKQSSASLALSTGQYLLLAASPPHERAGTPMERPSALRNNSSHIDSPALASRRRTVAR